MVIAPKALATRVCPPAPLIAGLAALLFFLAPAAIAQTDARTDPPTLARANIPPLTLPPEVAARVGRQVWRNETGGDHDAITAWNRGEAFASLGIGHFIWFPAGLDTPFQESFPAMLGFLRKRGTKLPAWLDRPEIPPCPWRTRSEFYRDFHKPRAYRLREFLHRTVAGQTESLVHRLDVTLPKLLSSTRAPTQRQQLRDQIVRLIRAAPDLYPLIDYVNFKGDGLNPKEHFPNRETGAPNGWGLRHVLLAMKGRPDDLGGARDAFADAARFVLLRRIRNNPKDARWRQGWMARVDSYRRPLR